VEARCGQVRPRVLSTTTLRDDVLGLLERRPAVGARVTGDDRKPSDQIRVLCGFTLRSLPGSTLNLELLLHRLATSRAVVRAGLSRTLVRRSTPGAGLARRTTSVGPSQSTGTGLFASTCFRDVSTVPTFHQVAFRRFALTTAFLAVVPPLSRPLISATSEARLARLARQTVAIPFGLRLRTAVGLSARRSIAVPLTPIGVASRFTAPLTDTSGHSVSIAPLAVFTHSEKGRVRSLEVIT
jgi:hypothetical protein